MISRTVYNLLTANAALTALVGTKIYPLRTPQTVAAPFIVYAFEADPIDTKDGRTTQEVFTVQITIFAATYESAQGIRTAVLTAMDRKNGTIVSNKVQTIVYEDTRESYDDKAELYQVDTSFAIRVNY